MLHVNHRFFALVSGLLFLLIGLGSGYTAFKGWNVIVGPWAVQLWVLWLVAFLGFILALSALRHLR